MIPTSATVVLMYNNTRIGHCRNVEVVFERDALNTTRQGDRDATYIPGLRRGSGQATLFYDPEDAVASGFINSIYNDNTATVSPLKMVFGSGSLEFVEFNAIVTRVSLAVSYGDAMACAIAFNLTGKYTGGKI